MVRNSADHGLETRPVEQALRENLAGPRGWDRAATSVSPFAYLERGRYADYLTPWLDAFPDGVQVQFLSELRDQDSAVARLYATIGVDPTFSPGDRRSAVNASVESAPALAPELTRELRAYFGESDRALSALLGRPLPWPTGSVGAEDE